MALHAHQCILFGEQLSKPRSCRGMLSLHTFICVADCTVVELLRDSCES